jgi:hypothetical protein
MTKTSYTNNLQPTGNHKAIQKQKNFFFALILLINGRREKKTLRV